MKKVIIGLVSVVLLLGIGTGVYAAASDNSGVFQEMLPFMQKMHPNLTDQQMKGMFNACQSSNGTGTGMQQMMKNVPHSGGMME